MLRGSLGVAAIKLPPVSFEHCLHQGWNCLCAQVCSSAGLHVRIFSPFTLAYYQLTLL